MIDEAPADLAGNPLIRAFAGGDGTLEASQWRSLTCDEAYNLSGRSRTAMAWIVEQLYKLHETEIPMSAEARRIFNETHGGVLLESFHEPLSATVARAMRLAASGRAVGSLPVPEDVLTAYQAQRNPDARRALCHAPASSLYFGATGEVTACCFGRSEPYGVWPQSSLQEIWFGPKPSALQAGMAGSSLPRLCKLCHEQMVARNFKNMLAAPYDHLVPLLPQAVASDGRRWPVKMEFELSTKCNLECAMCTGDLSSAIRANRDKLPPLPQVYDHRFVEQLEEFVPHLQEVKFLGGEPFLIEIYYSIWELFVEHNPDCVISIATNATVLSPKIVRLLEKLNFEIVISLDSLVPETYERIRVNAKFAKVIESVDRFARLSAARGRSISIAVCPMVNNWREMPALVRFANDRNATICFNTVAWPDHLSLRSLKPAVLQEVAHHFVDAIGVARTDTERANAEALLGLTAMVRSWAG